MKKGNPFIKTRGLEFIEVLIVALLIEFVIIFFFFFSKKVQEITRDSVRKKEVAQIGKMITNPCYIPDTIKENRKYDLFFILKEITEKDKDYGELLNKIRDPKTGTKKITMYFYEIDEDQEKCVLYANLESSFNEENLSLIKPIPGGGVGILKSKEDGWNGSPFYFQYSN